MLTNEVYIKKEKKCNQKIYQQSEQQKKMIREKNRHVYQGPLKNNDQRQTSNVLGVPP